MEKVWFTGCVRRNLGDGVGVSFWKHHWLGHQSLQKTFPLVFAGFEDKDVTVATAGNWLQDHWQRSLQFSTNMDHHCQEEAKLLRDILCDIAPDSGLPASWCWILEPHKCFSVRSCYQHISQLRPTVANTLDLGTISAMEISSLFQLVNSCFLAMSSILLRLLLVRFAVRKPKSNNTSSSTAIWL